MKSYNQVYKQSKSKVLAEKKALIESQKVMVINALKDEYMIESMSSLPKARKDEMLKKLLEYWSPKTGLKKAGERLLNESVINLDKNSSTRDIEHYIRRETKHNIGFVVECFRRANSSEVVERFRNIILESTDRNLRGETIKSLIWEVASEKLKEL